MRWATLLVVMAGCNRLFDLHATKLVDAYVLPDAPDGDHDGVPDATDNCPNDANADQADYDGDGVGDICDTCPMVANAQTADFDHDGVGDECDPHPTGPGDCLDVFDSFGDPSTFAAHWTIVSDPADTPEVTPTAGQLSLVPHVPYQVGVVSRDAPMDADAVMIAGQQDANAVGAIESVLVAGVMHEAGVKSGYRCWLTTSRVRAEVDLNNLESAFVGTQVRPDYLIRALVDQNGSVSVGCRIDWGLAVAATVLQLSPDPGDVGSAGVLAAYKPATITAIAVYSLATAPCPAKLIR